MAKSVLAFKKELRDLSDKLPEDTLRLALQKLALKALMGVVFKTPVDTGRARGGWQVELNGSSESDNERTDKGGTVAIAEGTRVINQVGPFDTIWIYNNVPYILRLEHGSSAQAPNGMVKVTLAELALEIDELKRSL